ncbi:MAG: hypothetical protein QOD41_4400 [Cryptosporangiaceae bacterium]|nr:hypothetical protein [Cryptosporangiaceae bacterium]
MVAVLVPALAFTAVGGLELRTRLLTTAALGDYADRVTLARDVAGLVHVVQQERDRTAGALGGVRRGGDPAAAASAVRGSTKDDREAVDTAVRAYRVQATALGVSPSGPVASRLRDASGALAELPRLRAAAAGGQLRDDAVFDGYSRLVAALIRIVPDSAVASGSADADVRGLHRLMQLKELQSQVRGRLAAVASAGQFGFGEYQAFADLRASRSAVAAQFRAESGPAQRVRFDEAVNGSPVLAEQRLERAAADRAPGARLGFDASQWWTAASAQLDLLRDAERRFSAAAITSAEDARAAASRRAVEVAGLILGIVLVAFAVSFAIGRSMAGALRKLRAEAMIVASHRLPDVIRRLGTGSTEDLPPEPDPAPPGPGDEIAEVAEAFTAVHRSAVRLAVEQATLRRNVSAMVVNLARRSQLLVDRQLAVLDELEAAEPDPDRLERLFALDHLTTRLRRNDENLLVLAAGESQRLWREPVRLSRVLLGALAETEQYQRVQVAGPDDVLVVGHAVPDLMHLLAELVDNATAFSAPATPVRLTAQLLYGGAGGALVTVDDDGMGMTPSMLAEANGRLARPAPIDVSVSERMGLFVVSHLAARLSIGVELATVTTGGVTATVTIPSGLLTPVDAAAGPAEAGATDRDAGERDPGDVLPVEVGAHAEGRRAPGRSLGQGEQTVALPVIPGVQRRSAAALARRGFAVRTRRDPEHAAPDPPPAPVDPAAGEPGGAAHVPRHAEPVSARVAAWWSGGETAPERAFADPVAEPVPRGVTAAGLPIRSPAGGGAAARPARDPGLPVRVPGASRADPDATDTGPAPPPADPGTVGDMLARFHSGVRRAGSAPDPD